MPIERTIVNNVRRVIGAISRFIPNIVVILRCPMDLIDCSWGSRGDVFVWCEAFGDDRRAKGVCAGPAHPA